MDVDTKKLRKDAVYHCNRLGMRTEDLLRWRQDAHPEKVIELLDELERLRAEVIDERAKLRREQDARANLRVELDRAKHYIGHLQRAAPVMLSVLALLADECDEAGIREVGIWYTEHSGCDHLKLWLDAERAKLATATAGPKEQLEQPGELGEVDHG